MSNFVLFILGRPTTAFDMYSSYVAGRLQGYFAQHAAAINLSISPRVIQPCSIVHSTKPTNTHAGCTYPGIPRLGTEYDRTSRRSFAC